MVKYIVIDDSCGEFVKFAEKDAMEEHIRYLIDDCEVDPNDVSIYSVDYELCINMQRTFTLEMRRDVL